MEGQSCGTDEQSLVDFCFSVGYRAADFFTGLKAEERKSRRTLRLSKGADLRKQTAFSPDAVDTTSGLRRVAHYRLRASHEFPANGLRDCELHRREEFLSICTGRRSKPERLHAGNRSLFFSALRFSARCPSTDLQTVNCDQFSEAQSLILAVHKVLVAEGAWRTTFALWTFLMQGRFR